MAREVIPRSDKSGELILEPEQQARIVVHDHPYLEENELGPVFLDVSRDEVGTIDRLGIKAVRLEIMLMGEAPGEHRTVTLEARTFAKWMEKKEAEIGPMLANADPVPQVRIGKQAVRGGERKDFAGRHAGYPHRGLTTDAEKLWVQTHLDEVNDNLGRDGERQIDLANPEHRARYGLDALASERGISTDEPVEQPQLSLAPDGDGEASSPTE